MNKEDEKLFLIPNTLDDKWYHSAFKSINYCIEKVIKTINKIFFLLILISLVFLVSFCLLSFFENNLLNDFIVYLLDKIHSNIQDVIYFTIGLFLLYFLKLFFLIIIYFNSSDFKAMMYWYFPKFYKMDYIPPSNIRIFI